MKLDSLILSNFKGIRALTLDAGGEDLSIYGDNSTGKTTLFDAFLWLLFDKDSTGAKNFELKTVDKEGRVFNGLDHSVAGTFGLDGVTLTLKKVYSEKWTKKRGSADKVFEGHTTDYFVDGVPVKAKEYTARIAELADESVFKLLTNPATFNEQLHWTERRAILIEVCGDVLTQDVIAGNAELAPLANVLARRTVEDHLKVLAAEKAAINKELEKLPVRIDEVTQGLPDVSELSAALIKSALDGHRATVEKLEAEQSTIKNGGRVAELNQKLAEHKKTLAELEAEALSKNSTVIEEKRRELNEKNRALDELIRTRDDARTRIAANAAQIAIGDAARDRLRADWQEESSRTFTPAPAGDCPTCGQALPADRVQEANSRAEADFKEAQSKRLEEITAQGNQYKAHVEILAAENVTLGKTADQAEAQLVLAMELINTLQSAVVSLEAAPAETAPMDKVKDEIALLLIELEVARTDTTAASQKLDADLARTRGFISDAEADLARLNQAEAGKKRIAELADQEKELAAQYEALERDLYLTEEFIRTKVSLMEERINGRFEHARFKLFREQINGGVEECCETTYNGVPYSGGLNNGARINVGLDIINTLSEHYGFGAPIFIDNAEAVTELIPTRAQTIRLVVSEADKKLRIETEPLKLKEAM